MSKKKAREILFKLVFELEFHKPEDSTMYEDFIADNDLEEENVKFVSNAYKSIIKNYDEIRDIIKNNTVGYSIERIFKIDLAILMVACYELKFEQDTPLEVVINEAVELAKKYSTDKSYTFINGILSKIVKNVRA